MTEKSLLEAFAGESQTYVKYLIFAEEAKKEGKSNITGLYRSIAYAEYAYANNLPTKDPICRF